MSGCRTKLPYKRVIFRLKGAENRALRQLA